MSTFKIKDEGVIGNPLVSVALLTYNHGEFIVQALESAIMQTGISSEIVIADDASTDNTRDIILEYQKRFPKKIKLILQEKNVGPNRNEMALLSNLSGKYIAFLEGDDYWTDPLKLKRQSDFLEMNNDFSSCFHNVRMLKDDKLEDDDMAEVKSVTTINDLATVNYIRTCSYMFRNNLFRDFSKDYENVHGADYFLFMMIAKHGKIRKLPDVMAVYRKHSSSIWSSKNIIDRYKTVIRNIEVMLPYFDNTVVKILKQHQAKYIFEFVTYVFDNKMVETEEEYISDLISSNRDLMYGGVTLQSHYDLSVIKHQKRSKSLFQKRLDKIISGIRKA